MAGKCGVLTDVGPVRLLSCNSSTLISAAGCLPSSRMYKLNDRTWRPPIAIYLRHAAALRLAPGRAEAVLAERGEPGLREPSLGELSRWELRRGELIGRLCRLFVLLGGPSNRIERLSIVHVVLARGNAGP